MEGLSKVPERPTIGFLVKYKSLIAEIYFKGIAASKKSKHVEPCNTPNTPIKSNKAQKAKSEIGLQSIAKSPFPKTSSIHLLQEQSP